MGLLEGKRAIVTGGGSGIGRAACRRMAEEGARVAVFDVNGEAADAVAAEIGGIGRAVDVGDVDAVRDAVDDVAARIPAQTPVRLTRRTRSHSAGSSSWSRLNADVPALL